MSVGFEISESGRFKGFAETIEEGGGFDQRQKGISRLNWKGAFTKICDFAIYLKGFQALYASKVVSYAQGFMLLAEASREFHWKLNYGAIALMWRGGCIIRSRFLGRIKDAFQKDPNLVNLLLNDFFLGAIQTAQVNGIFLRKQNDF